MNFFKKHKLIFEVCDDPTEISLEQVLCGAFGRVTLGPNGVALWVPGDNVPLEQEIIFDIRNRPLSEQDAVLFRKACKGRFMNAHIALITSTQPQRIKNILNHFDYVLVPDTRIKNTPEDFRNRVLSYIT